MLSPVFWNLDFDDLLRILVLKPTKSNGFADDLGILAVGKDPSVIRSNLQQALNVAIAWGLENGLKFSKTKTSVVAFGFRTSLISKLKQ